MATLVHKLKYHASGLTVVWLHWYISLNIMLVGLQWYGYTGT